MPGAGNGLGGAYAPAVSFANPGAPKTPGADGVPPGVAPSINGAGAYAPDWAALIQGDAGLKDAAAALAAGGAASKSQLDALLANAYESFGKNVDLSQLAKQLGMSESDIQDALGPDVQKLAQENTDAGLSTTARLDKANQDAIHQITANLNKRGILKSGEAGYEMDQQNLGYRQASQDAYQKFLGYLQQYQQGYVSAQQSNAQSLAQAYSSAADRQFTLNEGTGQATGQATGPGGSTTGTSAQFDHVDSAGRPVYKDGSGRLWNADGSQYAEAPPQPPQAPIDTAPTAPPTSFLPSHLRGGGRTAMAV